MNDDSFKNPLDKNDHSNNDQTAYTSNTFDAFDDGSNNRRLIWLLSGIILLGCGFIFTVAFFYFQPDAKPLIAQYFPSPTPTATATLTPTPTLTFTPTNTYTPTPNMTAQAYESTAVYVADEWQENVFETFDTNEFNWYVGTDDDSYAKILYQVKDGKYSWDATAHQGFMQHIRVRSAFIKDFYFSLDATQPGFTTAADYGIFFRENAFNEYYYFGISNKGYYSFWVLLKDEWKQLIDETTSEAILPRKANKIAVLAEGDHFTFFINGHYITEFIDNSLETGRVGMAAEVSEPDLNIVFEFDNVLIKLPK